MFGVVNTLAQVRLIRFRLSFVMSAGHTYGALVTRQETRHRMRMRIRMRWRMRMLGVGVGRGHGTPPHHVCVVEQSVIRFC